MTSEAPTPIFKQITGDDISDVIQIESLCLNCQEQGVTRLFLTRIPFFRDVIISSFSCDHCGHSNRNLDRASECQNKGIRYKFQVNNSKDLNRRIVQYGGSVFSIPHLDASFPNSEGQITTVEGCITSVIENLQANQEERKVDQPEVAEKIEAFIVKLKGLLHVDSPFEIVLDDPTGNSHIENPLAPSKDPHLTEEHYDRTPEQNAKLGASNPENENNEEKQEQSLDTFNSKNEVFVFESNCPNCKAACKTNMKLLDIPHFKETIIMCTVCDSCSYKDTEVKGGCGVSPLGVRLELHIKNADDLARDVIKSETAAVIIPELDLETEAGSITGKFTTVEGLIVTMKEQLSSANPFILGDSATDDDRHSKLKQIVDKLDDIASGRVKDVRFILDDPAGNSYIQNYMAPESDPQLIVTEYERTFQQNEDLGLNDIKTENYENDN